MKSGLTHPVLAPADHTETPSRAPKPNGDARFSQLRRAPWITAWRSRSNLFAHAVSLGEGTLSVPRGISSLSCRRHFAPNVMTHAQSTAICEQLAVSQRLQTACADGGGVSAPCRAVTRGRNQIEPFRGRPANHAHEWHRNRLATIRPPRSGQSSIDGSRPQL
jgi:hypothetical protein